MIMGIFMAAIAIGFLYYMVGLGDAILARERMQDAADATAFSSAVIHARGMNLIALLNIIMATLLAILVLLAMLASLLTYGADLLKGAAVFFPLLAGGIAPMQTAGKLAKQAEQTATPKVKRLIKATQKLQGPLAEAVPMVAALNALKMSTSRFRPVVTAGTTFPILSGLPTVDGKFDTLCTKAGEYAGNMASWPLKALLEPLGGVVASWISSRLESATKTVAAGYATYYCGGGVMPDLPSLPMKIGLPRLGTDAEKACTSDDKDSDPAACQEYQEELEQLYETYDKERGQCDNGTDDQDELCESVIKDARSKCEYEKDRKLVKFRWRQATKTYRYFVDKRGDKEVVSREVVREKDDSIVYKNPDIPETGLRFHNLVGLASPIPCRNKNGVLHANMGPWNATDMSKPLCEEQHDAPLLQYLKKRPGQTQEVDVLEVTDVLGCVREEKSSAKMNGQRMDKDVKESVPQEMCSCAAQGEEMFQIRSIVIGDPSELTAAADRRILVATLGKKPSEGVLGKLAEYSGMFAAAQAEFYYDGTDDRSKWLWNMRWKARMRRLYWDRKTWDCPAKEDNCPGASGEKISSNSSVAEVGNLKKIQALVKGGVNSIIVH